MLYLCAYLHGYLHAQKPNVCIHEVYPSLLGPNGKSSRTRKCEKQILAKEYYKCDEN